MVVLHAQGLRYQRDGSGTDAGFALQLDDLRLESGDRLGIVGPSGCGKSTLIDVLALLRRPSVVHRLALLHHDIVPLWQDGTVERCTALRAAHIGVVLQTGGLLASLPLRENVALGQRLLGQHDEAFIDQLLDALGLAHLQHRLPAQLSIGQRQRVAIARALAHRPALVLADEPTASLGAEHAGAALDLLLSLTHGTGAALVIVSHDVALLASRGVPMRRFRPEGDTMHLSEVVR